MPRLATHALPARRRSPGPVYLCVRGIYFLEPRLRAHPDYQRALRDMQAARAAGAVPLWLVRGRAFRWLRPAALPLARYSTPKGCYGSGFLEMGCAQRPVCTRIRGLHNRQPALLALQLTAGAACLRVRTWERRWAPTCGSCGWTAWQSRRLLRLTSPAASGKADLCAGPAASAPPFHGQAATPICLSVGWNGMGCWEGRGWQCRAWHHDRSRSTVLCRAEADPNCFHEMLMPPGALHLAVGRWGSTCIGTLRALPAKLSLVTSPRTLSYHLAQRPAAAAMRPAATAARRAAFAGWRVR